MDFFARQDQARRATKILVVYFGVAVLCIVAAIYAVGAAARMHFLQRAHRHHGPVYAEVEPLTGRLRAPGWWDAKLFLWVAGGTSSLIFFGSLYKILELSRGGSVVAAMLGGHPLQGNTAAPEERRLLNVVEEMAIASGVPMPEVYALEDEDGINAFAAGHATKDAVIGVTRGALRWLRRDELQGVIAHEFSHILNGDMRLNVRLIGIIHGILVVAVLGRLLLESGRYRVGSRKGGAVVPLFGLALLIIGWIGVFFGRLIQAAVSRQREILADASAVQFTRNPAGLAGALKKIGALAAGSRLRSPRAAEASHMFFSNGLRASWLNLFATHPPLVERIRALEPEFDGSFPKMAAPGGEEVLKPAPVPRPPPPLPGLPTSAIRVPGLGDLLGAQGAAFAAASQVRAERVVPTVGVPTPAHLVYAAGLRDSLPGPVVEAAREPFGAAALVYALLLSDEPATRAAQEQSLPGLAGEGLAREAVRLRPMVEGLPIEARLPLVSITLPALRNLSSGQYDQVKATVRALVEADQQIDLFEFMLLKVLHGQLETQFHPPEKLVAQYYSLRALAPDCAAVLSGVARFGHDDEGSVQAGFDAGARAVPLAGPELRLLRPEECGLAQISEALDRLAQAVPHIKRIVLEACARTAAQDEMIRFEEAELLRAVADTLDCPIPPFIEGV